MITHKDKFIFCPLSQFEVIGIIQAEDHKIIKLKYIKNVEFLKYIYIDNLLEDGNKNISTLYDDIALYPQKI